MCFAAAMCFPNLVSKEICLLRHIVIHYYEKKLISSVLNIITDAIHYVN